MNALRPYAKYIAAVMGVLGGGLRMWTLSLGVDENGLYPEAHPGWIGYLLLTAVMAVLFLWLCRQERPRHGFCRYATVYTLLAAAALVLSGVTAQQSDDRFSRIIGVVGILVALVLLSTLRYPFAQRRPMPPIGYAAACLYFVLEMFRLNLQFGGESEPIRFVPQFLACFAAGLACYQLWGAVVHWKAPKARPFWQHMAGYLCIAAAAGSRVVYALIGLWLLTDPVVPEEEPEEVEDSEEAEDIEEVDHWQEDL